MGKGSVPEIEKEREKSGTLIYFWTTLVPYCPGRIITCPMTWGFSSPRLKPSQKPMEHKSQSQPESILSKLVTVD